jgi:septal ring factor EnvC (AmiA/AmiB activator)
MRRRHLILFGTLIAALTGYGAVAQQDAGYSDPAETRRALAEAQQQGAAARARAEQLEAGATAAGAAAERSAAEAAGAAARIQQAEADVAAQQAAIALIDRQREALRARLAERQQPLLRLTAALQRLARRPLLFTLFRPGSVRDAMHMRALLATMLPEVTRRTADLRGELERSRALRATAEAAIGRVRDEQANLGRRRAALAALETQQRLAARQSAGVADREAERALALAEQASDLGALADDLGRAGALRDELARLPGPVMRPVQPGISNPLPVETTPAAIAVRPAMAVLLPVQGRLIAGFGAALPGQPRSRGVAIAARAGAQAISPAAGRVAFAGAYRGFGQIVIIDHAGGWTSLVTGLAQLDVRVGAELVAGSPLGTAGPGRPVITLELRRDGQPVNPLDFAKL